MGRKIDESNDNTQKYKVFYNPDCAKWGVLRYGNLMNDCMGERWQHVCLKEKPAYTKYRRVAIRLMGLIRSRNGE